MGDFRMTIEASGPHGCDRAAKAGTSQGSDIVHGCGRMDCPDCLFAAFVSQMQRAGMKPFVATFHHWPADMDEHLFLPGAERCPRCNRTREEIAKHDETRHPDDPVCSRTYRPETEVIDDYTERGLPYPSGGFTRATGRRVKGSF